MNNSVRVPTNLCELSRIHILTVRIIEVYLYGVIQEVPKRKSET